MFLEKRFEVSRNKGLMFFGRKIWCFQEKRFEVSRNKDLMFVGRKVWSFLMKRFEVSKKKVSSLLGERFDIWIYHFFQFFNPMVSWFFYFIYLATIHFRQKELYVAQEDCIFSWTFQLELNIEEYGIQVFSLSQQRDEDFSLVNIKQLNRLSISNLQLKLDTEVQGDTLPVTILHWIFPERIDASGLTDKEIQLNESIDRGEGSCLEALDGWISYIFYKYYFLKIDML